MKRMEFLYIIIFSFMFAACGGGGSSETPTSNAPVISNLNIVTPMSATLNEGNGLTYMSGTFEFEDSDADIAMMRLSVSNVGDVTTPFYPGTISGAVEILYEIPTVQAGQFDYNLWIVDSKGNESNSFSGTFYVTEDLDTAFGQNGLVLYDDAPSGFDEEAFGSVLQEDGKIVVVGREYNGLNDDVLVQRYLPDGVLDHAFADNGTLIFDSGNHEIAYGVVLHSDGKILLTGYINEYGSGNDNLLLIRLNTDGTYDTTFGINGIVTTNLSEYGEYSHAIALQNDGKMVIAGEVSVGGTDVQAFVARYENNGSLDNTFGTAGVSTYDGIGWDIAYGVTVQPDGKIVMTGSTSESAYPDVALTDLLLLRLNPDGTNDITFGTNGVVTYNSIYESGRAVDLQSDGKIVVVGNRWSYKSIDNAALLLRYNTNGTLDNAFGQNGGVIYKKEYGYPSISGNALSLMNNGKIVMAGYVNTDGFVVRVDSNGSYDDTLSIDGISAVVSGGLAQAKSVLVQNDGKIIVVGNSTYHDSFSDQAILLARLTGH